VAIIALGVDMASRTRNESASSLTAVRGRAAAESVFGASASTPTTQPSIVGLDADAPIQHVTL